MSTKTLETQVYTDKDYKTTLTREQMLRVREKMERGLKLAIQDNHEFAIKLMTIYISKVDAWFILHQHDEDEWLDASDAHWHIYDDEGICVECGARRK